MAPVATEQVGCVIKLTTGVEGVLGTALIVTVEAALVTQVLSAMLLTLKVYVPGVNPVNVAEAW
jgi:hypothetical protein